MCVCIYIHICAYIYAYFSGNYLFIEGTNKHLHICSSPMVTRWKPRCAFGYSDLQISQVLSSRHTSQTCSIKGICLTCHQEQRERRVWYLSRPQKYLHWYTGACTHTHTCLLKRCCASICCWGWISTLIDSLIIFIFLVFKYGCCRHFQKH